MFWSRKGDVIEQWCTAQWHAEKFMNSLIKSGISQDVAERVFLICWDREVRTDSVNKRINRNNWKHFHSVEQAVLDLAFHQTSVDFWFTEITMQEYEHWNSAGSRYSVKLALNPSRNPILHAFDEWMVEQVQPVIELRRQQTEWGRELQQAQRVYLEGA